MEELAYSEIRDNTDLLMAYNMASVCVLVLGGRAGIDHFFRFASHVDLRTNSKGVSNLMARIPDLREASIYLDRFNMYRFCFNTVNIFIRFSTKFDQFELHIVHGNKEIHEELLFTCSGSIEAVITPLCHSFIGIIPAIRNDVMQRYATRNRNGTTITKRTSRLLRRNRVKVDPGSQIPVQPESLKLPRKTVWKREEEINMKRRRTGMRGTRRGMFLTRYDMIRGEDVKGKRHNRKGRRERWDWREAIQHSNNEGVDGKEADLNRLRVDGYR